MSDETTAITMDSTDANKAFLRSAIGPLVIQPVLAQSVATQVASTIEIDEATAELRVPIVAADPTAQWTAESQEIAASNAELGEVASSFRKVAALSVLSSELANDSNPAIAQVVGQGLARDISRQLDNAFFGSNAEAPYTQPSGLEDLSNPNIVYGGSTWTNFDPFTEAIFAAQTAGGRLSAFVANPEDAEELAQLKVATGSNQTLLQPAGDATQPTRLQISGIPLHVTTAVAEGTVWGLDSTQNFVGMRQDTELKIDESAYFSSDQIALRAILRATFAFANEAAVQKIVKQNKPSNG